VLETISRLFDTAANAVDSSRKWKNLIRIFVSHTYRITKAIAADQLAILDNLIDTSV